MVGPAKRNDQELWRWDGQFLRNKSNDLVLDIRKGRLRLIQETEICLYTPKPESEAHNQLWGVRDGAFDVYGRPQPDHTLIYSLSNDDWVLDIQHATNPDETTNKLILFPYQSMDNDTQQWIFIDENASSLLDEPVTITTSTTMFKSSSSSSSSTNNASVNLSPSTSASSSPVTTSTVASSNTHDLSASAELFAHGLSPAKRGSQSSVTLVSIEAYRECHQNVYLEKNPRLSDKAIAMAAAYETWKKWNQERVNSLDQPDRLQYHEVDKIRSCLQSTAQSELSNHKETALCLANRLVIQLYEQVLTTP
ncbi:hypothetical protein BDC45DRAFT_436338 [Circinella umbellata]|nr:hypothetical protein BDC45DRAFT_436338 [Circinella umbellata]